MSREKLQFSAMHKSSPGLLKALDKPRAFQIGYKVPDKALGRRKSMGKK